MDDWRATSKIASHWEPREDNWVECRLCPRHCKLAPGQFGFCQVRGNFNGSCHTYNYGKSVTATEEIIETEAVNHFMPGSRILCLGNIGCMFSCDFCQNWQTSQVKHLDPSNIKLYTPRQVVDMALANNINVISWTYNDPVVWHEFVLETAKLAKEFGIKNLYKSAFSIEKEPVDELIEVMDIFSISFKSMDEDFYRKYTKGNLAPVLERIKQVHKSGVHLELSQLLVTKRNEDKENIHRTVNWVLANLGTDVPLHFVAFHPAFKYLHVDRTPLESLLAARKIAISKGIKHCYLGNVYKDGLSDTVCRTCSNILVKRFGASSVVQGIAKDGLCSICGAPTPIKYPFGNQSVKILSEASWKTKREKNFTWDNEIQNIHLVLPEVATDSIRVKIIHDKNILPQNLTLGGLGPKRVIVSKASVNETGIKIYWDSEVDLTIMPVLDRAHFPVSERVREIR